MAVQWLGLRAFTDEGTGSNPGLENKIPQASLQDQKKKKKCIEVKSMNAGARLIDTGPRSTYSRLGQLCLSSSSISESESRSVMSDSLQPHGLYSLWNSPGQNPGVGSLSLLQRIFPTQESNRGLLHCRGILYQLSHQGSPFPTVIWV